MSWFKKLRDSINPGEDDDNTYDEDEFEEDYSLGGYDSGMNEMPVNSGFGQQNPVYNQPSQNYGNNYQPPAAGNSQQPPPPSSTFVTSVPGGDAHASFEVKVIKPERYIDGKRIADLLMARKTVIVNFDETNKEIIRKLLDFMAGTVYTIKGDLKQISDRTFIATPPNATVSAEQLRNAERDDINRDSPIY